MNWRDKEKVIEAGFKIIRERDHFPIGQTTQEMKSPFTIVVCTGNSSWRKLQGFKTKKARRAEMDRLLKSSLYLED